VLISIRISNKACRCNARETDGNIDDDLLAKAAKLTGPKDRSAMVREGLRALIERESVLGFIERHGLHGMGIRYVDVHLLASVALTDGATLWTRDKRLHAATDSLGFTYQSASAH
jgi:hypothetical protein